MSGQTLIWYPVNGNGNVEMERARVEGGWLYRSVRQSPCPHVTALAFVPDRESKEKA